jgi:hypothetical protein
LLLECDSYLAVGGFADLLDPPDNPYVRDAAGWVRDVMGEHL